MNDPDLNQRILQSASDAVVPLGTDPTRHPWFTMGRATILLVVIFGLAGLAVIASVFITARTVSNTPEQTERIVSRAVDQVQAEVDRRTEARDAESARAREDFTRAVCAVLRTLPDDGGAVRDLGANLHCPVIRRSIAS